MDVIQSFEETDVATAFRATTLTIRVDQTRSLSELTEQLVAATARLAAETHLTNTLFVLEDPPQAEPAGPPATSVEEVRRWERAVRRVEQSNALSVVVMQSICSGPGSDILLAADYRIGTPEARLMFTTDDGHLWPGMALYRLVRQVGPARVRRLMVRGGAFSANEALELGVLDELTPEPETVAERVIHGTSRLSRSALAVCRQLLHEAVSVEFDDALGVHLAACDRELRRRND
ncbi:enoyl-CoA hydratase/isomerase family protein [Nocardia beijingensis]|uniref:enoyl-CoA-hydratase DpgB n=1 Tax=Nocardia beijingensis TaxID=95162 RepID=UPI0018933C43|nr:enoyl-CoA-hydratase DpgB [Nocardia beijingensis]MBF6465953.1 enoyl-CoA hydratase/isomerase family protein [Nocardia beijingensis]